MIVKSSLSLITKAGIFSLIGFAVIAAASYLIFGLKSMTNFVSIISGAALTLVLFFASISLYRLLAGKEFSIAGRFIFLNFFGKLIITAAIFYLFTKIKYINLIYFFISFAVFFTVFLNIEIFLIYKKILFKN